MGKVFYIKLDHDYMKDEKVRNVRREGGKVALLNVVNLFVVLSRNKGRIDWNNFGQREDAADYMMLSERKLEEFLDLCAKHGLIDPDEWWNNRVAFSRRAEDDSKLAQSRSKAGKQGGESSGKSRRADEGNARVKQTDEASA